MASTGQNVEMIAGDSRTLDIVVYESDLTTPADLTGVTARWWLARSVRSTGSNIFLQKTSPSGGIAITASEGRVVVTLSPADTKDLEQGVYYHECELKDATNDVATVLSGAFVIRPGVIPAT